ncbi:MAG: alpha-hydroxy-acid oxidizing protein [Acidimicrobiia bacterium]|nr:alpha-hydroxy-acid oxidizing protein [Acidimicrobiia bacterium]
MAASADPGELRTIDQIIARAREITDPGAHAWAAAGAGQGVTVARNALALNRLALLPRVGRDVSDVDTSSTFVGAPLAFPVMLAPVAALALYDPADAAAAATAAAEMGTSAINSIHMTSPWEEVAATSPGHHFFQLYVAGDRGWMAEILSRVRAAQFGGICVTVDAPVIGRRDRSLEQDFIWRSPGRGTDGLRQHGWDESFRSRFAWPDLQWICSETDLPVFAKGVMTAEDATVAVDCGVAGVFVSNHGGRMVDHGLSSIEVLGEIVEAVADGVDVAVDSGFARGADVCKALALGAKAVGIGRLQCWGLAAGGVAGLVRVLEILNEEIALTMANIGARSVGEITPDYVRWSITVPPPEPG